jgi:hypothetical protein
MTQPNVGAVESTPSGSLSAFTLSEANVMGAAGTVAAARPAAGTKNGTQTVRAMTIRRGIRRREATSFIESNFIIPRLY